MPQHIYLTGYRGTGKTSVGQILANRLGRWMTDLDDRVESAAGKSIREIFDFGGEEAFRDWETKCLEQVVNEDNRVVSLGGGAILREKNRQLIARSGTCVWLDADAKTLAGRILGDQTSGQRRPSLTDLDPVAEIEQMLAKRKSLYRDASQLRIDTANKTLEAVAAEIERWLADPQKS